MKRKYLTENPFEAMATYNPAPVLLRRPLNEEEMRALLALERYKMSFARARKPMPDDIPTNPLLFLPVQTAEMIYADLKKAGGPIKRWRARLTSMHVGLLSSIW